MSTKTENLKNNNMFYLMSFRTTKKQVTGFSFKLVRYDIVQKVFRSTEIVEELYKPKLFQRKENKLKNGIWHKKFKKLYSKSPDLSNKKNLIYDVVSKPENVVFTTTMDDVAIKFLKKKLPKLEMDNIRIIDDEPLKISPNWENIETVEDVFSDIRVFKNFIEKNL